MGPWMRRQRHTMVPPLDYRHGREKQSQLLQIYLLQYLTHAHVVVSITHYDVTKMHEGFCVLSILAMILFISSS